MTSTCQLYQTTCPYCGVGCGVDIEVKHEAGQILPVSLQGTPEHPANYGRLCVKGSHLLETTGLDHRLLYPEVSGEQVSWEKATSKVASSFKRIIDEHGPDSVALYVSGQLLTEDYYIANKLMKGYIGSANIDTNSRLCMSSAVAGYKRAFGEDIVPCDYEDLEQTDFLVLIGSNAAWTHPVLYQRIERAKKRNPAMQVVAIDTRRTATVELADLFLNIKPGTDAALYNGLLNYAATNGYSDDPFISQHTEGWQEVLATCAAWTVEKVAEFCELSETDVEHFYYSFCGAKTALSFYSMGINQSASGVDKCNAIINAHLATGQLLKPGAGPFSITGQPNAMGGREVGGLANQLAAHMDIEQATHRELVQQFWQSPGMAIRQGTKAVELFEQIEQGRIKAVWIIATNPMVSLPNRAQVEQALAKCELVVVSDCVQKNDTLEYAHVKLPATGWLEKSGTVTNSERRISRQRGVVASPGEARHDWKILCDVATRMGFSGFDFTSPAEIFDEWARLTAFKNDGSRQLNLAGLVGLSAAEYDQLRPIKWPVVAKSNAPNNGKVFVNRRFSHASGNARFIPVIPQLPVQQTCTTYPLVMNSGRVRDQWHTMTRTGKAATLTTHTDKPYISLHPIDARKYEVAEGDLVKASSATGYVIAYAHVTDSVRKGECFMPIHWNRQFASSANVSALYQSVVDPVSGQPESKHAAINLHKVTFASHAQLFCRQDLQVNTDFWVKTRLAAGFHVQVAQRDSNMNFLNWCQQLTQAKGEWISFKHDGILNVQCMQNGRLYFAAFVSQQAPKLSAEWVNHLLRQTSLEGEDITSLLYARPSATFTNGKLVCSCFKVHEKQITEAIGNGANSVEMLGERLKCGTNCGSCKSELAQILSVYDQPTQDDELNVVNL